MADEWSEFAVYADVASAEAVAGLLRAESVPVYVARDEPVPGLVHSVRVLVPPTLLHRAKWVVSQMQLSDAELDQLAAVARGDKKSRDV